MYRLFLAVIFGSMLMAPYAHSQLVINELMQSNITYVFDDLKEYPDSWVELYNAGETEVSLSEYSLGVKEKASKAYSLPEKVVAPGEYVLVYCDKVGSGLHADIRLESGNNGIVRLFHNGELCDAVEQMVAQPAPDVSYGRVTDGSEDWGYQLQPTPGLSNAGGVTTADKILPEPEFSHYGCVSTEPFQLTMSIPEGLPEGTVLHYSLDCSDVTAESPEYDGTPIDISKSTIVRARLFCDGYLSPTATTQSYIFHYRESDLPLISMVANPEMLYSTDKGILMSPHCYKDYRRPVNFEYFEGANSPAILNQLCETRTGGGWTSRNRPQKTFMVYANKRFGAKRLNHEFFPVQRPGVTDFKSLMIRNAGNDYDHLYLRDAAVQRNVGMNIDNLDWQAERLCVLYINGEYKGLRHIRERSNEDNVFTNHGGLEDVDMVENWEELKEGSFDSFVEFREFYMKEPEGENIVEEYRARLDVEEFLDSYLVNFFYLNVDWPGNNFILWRPSAEGGKWRSIIKDMDWILGYRDSSPYAPHIKTMIDVADPVTGTEVGKVCMSLFRNVMQIDEFRNIFIDHALVYMADFLNPEKTVSQMEFLKNAMMPEWEKHCEVANVDIPFEKYEEEYEAACDWLDKRYRFFYEHIADYFSLGSLVPFEFVPLTGIEASYSLNNVNVRNHELNGKWVAGREFVLKSDNPEINSWKITKTSIADNSVLEETVSGPECRMTFPENYAFRIEPGMSEVSGVNVPEINQDSALETDYYNPLGQKVNGSTLKRGVYVGRCGAKAVKILIK